MAGPTKDELVERAAALDVELPNSATKRQIAEAIIADHGNDELALAELGDDAPQVLQPGTPEEVGRPPLAEVAAERAANRKQRRRVIGDAGEEE